MTRQKKSQRIPLHQTSYTRDAKVTALRKSEKRVRETGTDMKKKMALNKYLSIITLNINGINAPIKRHRKLNG